LSLPVPLPESETNTTERPDLDGAHVSQRI
jgi:hypothetical protein